MGENTREAIIDGALRAFRRNPEASMDDVANQAGLTRMTVYRYFRKRDSLMEALALRGHSIFMREFKKAWDSDLPPKEKLRGFVAGLVPEWDNFYFFNYEPLYTTSAVVGRIRRTESGCFQMWAELLREAGVIAADRPLTWSTRLLSYAFTCTCNFYCEENYSAEEAARLFTATITGGL